MSRAANKLIKAAAGAGVEDTGDDDFANVVLLLDGDGSNGDANNTFTDSGSVGATVTENGDVVQGSFSPYGNNWSVYFDGQSTLDVGSNNYVTNLGSGDLTVEFFINTTDTSCNLLNPNTNTGSGYWGLMIQSGDLRWNNAYNSTNLWIVDGAPILDGEWHHVAIVRNSGTFAVYYDGVAQSLQSGSFSDTTNYSGANKLRIGDGNLNHFTGYLSNVKLITANAIYTSDFDPPTSQLENTPSGGYVKCLVCRDNRFIDSGNYDHDVTISQNTPKVTPFGPFKDDDARDITTDGGSALFGPSGDYLQLPSNSAYNATSSLCAECWFYMVGAPSSGPSAHCPMSRWASTSLGQRSWFFDVENTGIRMRVDTSNNAAGQVVTDDSTGALNRYAWYHIALTWDGSTYRGFLNGESIGSLSDSAAPRGTSQVIRIGYNLNTHYMDGYVSDCRVLVDQGAVYTSAFTPPTAPLGGLGNVTGTAGTLNYVQYENKSFSVASQETNPQGVRFKSDGTKMYVIGNTGDDVGQYSLSTAWDVSTASFDSVTLSVSSQDSIPNGLVFSSDGTKLYITGNTNNKIFQYDLSTAWDLSTASYANKSLSVQGSSPIEPFIHPSGTSIYNIDSDSETVYQYTMTTAFDLSTASYANKSINVNSQETVPTSLVFSSNGTKMFVAGQTGDDINQYTLSTAWDVSTASFDNLIFDSSSQAVNPSGIDLKPDDTKLYMVSNNTDTVYQYDLTATKQPEVLLNFQDAGIYDRTGINTIDTVGNAQIDTSVKKYGTGSMKFDGTDDELLVEEETDELTFSTFDFTVEMWAYFDSLSGTRVLMDWRNGTGNQGTYPTLYFSGTTLYFYNGTNRLNASLATSTWYHIALTRGNGTTRLFIDGTQSGGTYSDSTNYLGPQGGFLTIGGLNQSYEIDGYIDDLRITKGVARYTANFTPPTAALPKF